MSTVTGSSKYEKAIKERKEIRYKDEIEFLKEFFPSITSDNLIIGTILKLLADDGEENEDLDSTKPGVSDYEVNDFLILVGQLAKNNKAT